ncbi:hypothetical protein [Streptomyces sp. NPDC050121]|uniref:hypothetical protein n=1 Tax=Streptomyces sp. NPDC050121 TaxID=3365601 RepID=UPI0037A35934
MDPYLATADTPNGFGCPGGPRTRCVLFLFNLVVAAVVPFVVDGAQGVMTAVGMGAGVSLLRS